MTTGRAIKSLSGLSPTSSSNAARLGGRLWQIGALYKLYGDDCIAVFDRAVDKFVVVDACELKDHGELPAVLERNRMTESDENASGVKVILS
jgi:hypothetical protein